MRSSQQPADDPRPDIQIALGATHVDREPSAACARDETAGTFFNQMHGFVNNLRPKSRGEVRDTRPFGDVPWALLDLARSCDICGPLADARTRRALDRR